MFREFRMTFAQGSAAIRRRVATVPSSDAFLGEDELALVTRQRTIRRK
jgi:hypothetical protein